MGKKTSIKVVSIIEPVGGHGGMEFIDYELCKSVINKGYKVLFFTSDKTKLFTIKGLDVFFYFRGIYGKAPKIFRVFLFILHISRSLIASRFRSSRIVHYHLFRATILELIMMYLTKMLGFKIVISAHDVESFAESNTNAIVKKVYQSADSIIAHSLIGYIEIRDKFKIKESKISQIPLGNYIDYLPRLIDRKKSRSSFNIIDESPVLLFFGQIKKVKGLDVLLNALPLVINKYPNVKLIIAGKLWQTGFSEYEKIISENKLNDFINLNLRYISDEIVEQFFYAADITILPYRKIYQSAVLLLGMSAGCPILASNITGMSEIIQDGENGFLFENDNYISLSEKIIKILGDKNKLTQVKENALEYVINNHSWDKVGQLTSTVYDSIWSKK